MACFRMLAQLMGLPFRRDALEKTIRDALRGGKQPNLPMLGQLVQAWDFMPPAPRCRQPVHPNERALPDRMGRRIRRGGAQ